MTVEIIEFNWNDRQKGRAKSVGAGVWSLR